MKTFDSSDILSMEKIRNIQSELLIETVNRAYKNSSYYRKIFDSQNLTPSSIKGIESIEELPFTERSDFEKDNWAFLTTSRQDISEIVSTTGTTGKPVFIALTKNDLNRLAYNEEKSFGCSGARSGDLFHIAVTCDNLFIAGIAYYTGLLRLGVSVVRIGPQNIIRHLELIQKLNPNGIVAVPSLMVQIIRRAVQNGLDLKNVGIEKIVLIGDSIRNLDFSTNNLGRLIEDCFDNTCFSTYGITEGQVSFCECEIRRGLHSHPNIVLVEIINDEGIPLPDGELGELVLTTFQVEGMPLIRYKTGDVTFKISESCRCGRNSIRIGPILGRKNHRLKVKGVTLYPKTIENAIIDIEDVINYQIEAYTGTDHTDHIILRIGSHRNDDSFRSLIIENLRANARVTSEIEIESPDNITRRLFQGGSRKAITFKDKRARLT